jgi:hypothetical protein
MIKNVKKSQALNRYLHFAIVKLELEEEIFV